MKNILALTVFLFFMRTAQAQDYHHYFISWNDEYTQYFGVMAVNTHTPTQILRLIYYSRQTGEYHLIEEKFRLSFDGKRFLLASTYLSDRTSCYSGYAAHYNPDNFYMIEDGQSIEMWNIDDAGVLAPLSEEYIPLSEIDNYKPIFWPEAYNICNTTYWHSLVQAIVR